MSGAKMVKSGILGACILALMSTTALAGGLFTRHEPVGSLKDAPLVLVGSIWDGLYLGGHAGYGWADMAGTPATTVDLDGSGFLYGAHIGYQKMVETNFVLGIEADLSPADIDDSIGTTSGGIDTLYTVRARGGVMVEQVLFYLTGGVAWADIDYRDTGLGINASDTELGWTAGLGVEAMFGPGWSGRAEYLYADFGEIDLGAGRDIDATLHQLRLGVSYHFTSY